MRKLKDNAARSFDFASLRSDERALRFGVPRFACLKLLVAAVSADSLVLPPATAAATSLRRRLHFHRGADLDVIVK